MTVLTIDHANTTLEQLARLKIRRAGSKTYKPVPHAALLAAVSKNLRKWFPSAKPFNVYLSRRGVDVLAGAFPAAGDGVRAGIALAASTAQRRRLTVFCGAVGKGGGPVVAGAAKWKPYDAEFDLEAEAEAVVVWWGNEVTKMWEGYGLLSGTPLAPTDVKRFLFDACQTKMNVPGYGEETVIPIRKVGAVAAAFHAREDQTAWAFLEAAGKVMLDAPGTPMLMDRLHRLYGVVTGSRAKPQKVAV